MNVAQWAEPQEVKELVCGTKPINTQCSIMGCTSYGSCNEVVY